jgi:hypothetical protein
MGSMAANTVVSGRHLVGRFMGAGVITAVFSAIAWSVFGTIVIPPEETVAFGQVMGTSVAGAVGALLLFAVISWLIRRSIQAMWGVAGVGLLLSYLPIGLAGVAAPSAAALALMHVADRVPGQPAHEE